MKTIFFACALILLLVCGFAQTKIAEPSKITEQELVRRTQELFDAVAPGNPEPWQKYFADDAMYFDEKGRSMDKAALVKDVAPLPRGYSGQIAIVHVKSHIENSTAILSYDMDETEVIYNQQLHARYHATDTWMYRNGKWQIVAGQVLRYYEDPALGTSDPERFKDYLGQYELAPGVVRTVSAENGHLYVQRQDRPREELLPEADCIFFRKGVEGRILFRSGGSQKIDALVDRRNNEDVIWKKTGQ
ncbi:MAG TPA: DUF4440 domain-containing protein [Candidatus Angelobacter sp.]|jgi:hypothetical protein|nr:DUF4440 domain-containing protein [Candidatus Angelobacter sp.]